MAIAHSGPRVRAASSSSSYHRYNEFGYLRQAHLAQTSPELASASSCRFYKLFILVKQFWHTMMRFFFGSTPLKVERRIHVVLNDCVAHNLYHCRVPKALLLAGLREGRGAATMAHQELMSRFRSKMRRLLMKLTAFGYLSLVVDDPRMIARTTLWI